MWYGGERFNDKYIQVGLVIHAYSKIQESGHDFECGLNKELILQLGIEVPYNCSLERFAAMIISYHLNGEPA